MGDTVPPVSYSMVDFVFALKCVKHKTKKAFYCAYIKTILLCMLENKPTDLPPLNRGIIKRGGAAFNHLLIPLNS
jgi:hypothetical protein